MACSTGPGTASTAGDWPVYHRSADRRGVDAVSSPVVHLKPAWGVLLDGPLLASPLIVGETVVAATENDTVYGFSAVSGCLAWSTHLGEAVDATRQRCYPFPKIGITATPAIDAGAGLIYVVAYHQPATHTLFALDLASGRIRRQLDIDPPGSDPPSQLTRSAVTLGNGRVYVSFGGRAGDCGDYHGYVVGVSPDLAGEQDVYAVPAKRQGAIWNPSGLTVLPSGDLLLSTGNSSATLNPDGGNSVIRLTWKLREVDSFTPQNWADLDRRDFDLGSVGPTLLKDDRVFQVGKDGIAYLLDAHHLGGVGGQLRSASLQGCYAIGATAYLDPFVYVPCDHGLKAVDVSGERIRLAWKSLDIRAGSPIVAGGMIWSIDFEGGYLYAFDRRDGKVRVRSRIGVAEHFVSPSSSNGRLFVPAGRYLLAYSGV